MQARMSADCCGKLDLSVVGVHVDFLESNKTIHSMDVPGCKFDVAYRIWSGLMIRPTFLYGHGKGKDELIQGGVGLGFCFPIYNEQLYITPLVGFTAGRVQTVVKIPFALPAPVELSITEKFRSYSPYLALEGSYHFTSRFRIVANVQYTWSWTKTTFTPFISQVFEPVHSRSEGFTYAGLIEYDLNDHWSINAGAAYNLSLTKEKHGLRLWGGKVGLAYWF